MRQDWTSWRRFAVIAAAMGLLLVIAAAISDFVIASYWRRHAMLTSLVADLVVVLVSAAVVTQWIDRRNRRQWNVLAQNVMFSLAQGARLTWTSLITLQGLATADQEGEAAAGTAENLALAQDPQSVLNATEQLLLDPKRRQLLQLVVRRLSEQMAKVITDWASIMVGAAPYAHLIDSHVELQSRLEWLSAVMDHREPPPDQDGRRRRLTRASIAVSAVSHLGDEWLRDQASAITVLAAKLDHESLDLAFSLNSPDWWSLRTDQILGRRAARH
jgi:hypothetical protein